MAEGESVPPDRPLYGRFTELFERNQVILREILEENSTAGEKGSADEQKIGDYYASCMDMGAIEKKGIAHWHPNWSESPRSRILTVWRRCLPTFPW
jgi:predicted metalloendopeptidase